MINCSDMGPSYCLSGKQKRDQVQGGLLAGTIKDLRIGIRRTLGVLLQTFGSVIFLMRWFPVFPGMGPMVRRLFGGRIFSTFGGLIDRSPEGTYCVGYFRKERELHLCFS